MTSPQDPFAPPPGDRPEGQPPTGGGDPADGRAPGYGSSPGYGSTPGYGTQPTYGSPGSGDTSGQSGYGSRPTSGEPGYGSQPTSGQPTYGSPPYGSPAYGSPAYGSPGSSPFGAPPAYGQSPYGQSPYGGPSGWNGPPLASWGLRVAGSLIDGVIVTVLATLAGLVDQGLGSLVNVVLFLYFGYLTGTTGQTPGRKLMRISVLREADGTHLGAGAGIGRSFLHILDVLSLGLGYLWPIWDAKKQTFADKAIHSVVVKV